MSNKPTYLTVNQFVEKNPAFTVGGIRWLIFNEMHNGFHRVVMRIGRKILIDEDAFFHWMDEINSERNSRCKNEND